jgi:hypothetical protein
LRHRILADAGAAGIDLATDTAELERGSVTAFCASYVRLLDSVETSSSLSM